MHIKSDCWLDAVLVTFTFHLYVKLSSFLSLQSLLGHTVFALGFARVFELIFWVGSFKELADWNGSRLPGYIVLLSQLGHLIVMADFFFYYFMSISKGQPMELPTTYSGLV